MWHDALYLQDPNTSEDDDEGDTGDDWADVEVRYLWCDRSVYEMPWGTWALRKELEEAQAKGLRTRRLAIARLRGANHFVSCTSSGHGGAALLTRICQVHWDQPERLLRALLAEETEGL